jgi:hypothetical protein
MRKILLTALVMAHGVFVMSIAKAELSISGYQEFYGVSVDQTTSAGLDTASQTDTATSGLSNGRFTRIIATGTTTLDSGLEVTGVYAISKDGAAAGDTDTNIVAVNENGLYVSGGFGSIGIGNIFSAGTMTHNRGTTMIPTAEPDNNVYGFYPVAGGGTGGYGAFDEAGYALDGMKMRFDSNVYEGFSASVSYESCMEKTTANASAVDCNGGTYANYDDVIDIAVRYAGSMEGVDYNITYGNVSGNTQILNNVEANDLEAQVYSANVAFAGFSAIYKYHTYGDSGLVKANVSDGNGTGAVTAVTYKMGNVTLGYVHAETSIEIGTNAADSSAEWDIFGVGYNLGGGVMIEASHGTKEEIDGSDSVKDTEADISVLKLSFGF